MARSPIRRSLAARPVIMRVVAGILLSTLPLVIATCRADDLLRPLGSAMIEIAVSGDTVAVAGESQLSAEVTVDGTPRNDLPLRWTTSDSTIAVVDATGKVRGVRRGRVEISAILERTALSNAAVTAGDTVWIVAAALGVAPSDTAFTALGDTLCVGHVVTDAAGDTLSNVPAAFSLQSDPDSTVRLASPPNCVVARATGTPAVIRARVDTLTADAQLAVQQVATTVAVTPQSQALTRGGTVPLSADARDSRGNAVANATIGWMSTNTGVASVDGTGRVTANAIGLAYIRATVNQALDSARIDVVSQAPEAPTGLGQAQSDGTPINPGQSSLTTTILFTGSVTDSDPGDMVRLEVEVKPIGVSFDGSGLATGTQVASGATSTVTLRVPDDANYHWRARARDQSDSTSAWVTFGTADINTTDFHIPQVPEPPFDPDPATMQQLKIDASTQIPLGTSTDQTDVVFKVPVSDPDPGAAIRAEVEVKAVGAAFDGSGTDTSTTVASGATAQLTVSALAQDTDYHWRARAIDQDGRTSSWVSFGGNAESATDFRVAVPEPPSAPTGIDQFKAAGTPAIATGATTDQNSVVFKGNVSDPDQGDQVRLEVEVKDINTPFDWSQTVLGALVPSGTQATVVVNNLADNTSYHWRVRAVDQTGRTSGPAPFGGNSDTPPAEVDFRVVVPEPPATPSGLGQFKSDGSTAIAQGANTDESTVVLRATVPADPDPGDQVRLDLEVRPVAQAFTGTPTHSNALGAAGTVSITVSGLSDNTTYHWRARTRDQSDSASAWVEFGSTGTDFAVVVPDAPGAPTTLAQFKSDGATSITAGTTTDESTVIFEATVTDPDLGDALVLQVEAKPLATAFDETGIQTGTVSVSDGQKARVTFTGLTDATDYKWRARTRDQTGRFSVWVEFPNAGTDFAVALPDDPDAPTGLGQFKSDASTAIAVGGTTDESTVVFKATVTDPDLGDQLVVEVEVKETGVTFANSPTATGATTVSSGQVATVTVSGLSDDKNYHWQARAKDQTGRTGTWMSFGGNNDPGDTDFAVAVPQNPTAPTSLQQRKNTGGAVIAVGDTTDEVTVKLEGLVTDPDPSDQVDLQLEVIVAGGAFSGTPTHTSGLVARGSTPQVTVALSENVNYEWRARTRDDTDRFSGWVSFGGSDGTTDFRTSVPEDPAAPAEANLKQFQSDGATQIAGGGNATSATVVLEGVVTDPDPGDRLRLEVEYRVTTLALDGNGTIVLGTVDVASGGTARVTVSGLSDNTNYHWRARAVDQDNRRGLWTSFGGSDGTTDFATVIPDNPNDPTSPAQFKSDGTTAITVGTETDENTVVLKATVTDPDGTDQLFIDVEVQPVGTAFSNTPTHNGSSSVADGGTATVTVNALSNLTNYHWQVRTRDATGRTSGWVSFGANAESATDFSVNIPGAPDNPTNLAQFKSDGSTSITQGATTDESTLVLKGDVSDINAGDMLRLEVEVKEVGIDFNGTNLAISASAVSNPGTAQVTVSGLTDDKSYHWRARTVDQLNNRSAWVSFGTNSDPNDTDFAVAVPQNPTAPTSLQQRRADGTTVIAVGDTTNATTVSLEGTVTDPDPSDQVELQLEVIVAGGTFSGTQTHTSGLVARGSTPKVTVSGLSENVNYEWRARTRDNTSRTSVWVDFNGSAGTTDFRTSIPEPPVAPSALAQFQIDGTSSIAAGGTDTTSSIVIKATVTDPDPGDFLKLEAEVKTTGTAFNETGLVLGSATVPSGGTAQITVTGLSDDTNYHWRVRTVDRDGQTSAWTRFSPTDATVDFATAIPQNPNDPTTLTQFKSNATEQIAQGATTDESTVVLKGVVSDPDASDVLRIQVEVKEINVSFNESGLTTGATAVANGGTAQVTVSGLADDKNYHWRARTIDQNNRVSGWVSFSGSDGTTDFRVAVPQIPNTPAALDQLEHTATFSIALADTSKSDTVVFKGTVSDPDAGDVVRLQVEIQTTGTDFTDIPTATSSSVASGGTVTVRVTSIGDNQAYHWQARTIDQTGRTSAWVSFGGNADPSDTDFRIWNPESPATVSGPAQHKTDATTPIGTGGVTDETTVVFQAGVSDPDPGDSLKLQIELRAVGTAFTGTATNTGNTAVPSGGTASVTVTGLVENTSYHWQVRAIDELGNVGPWTAFGGNADSPLPAATDFAVNATPENPSPVPSNLKQFNGATELNVGDNVTGGGLTATVTFKATVFDIDPGDILSVEIEARQTGTNFSDAATSTVTVTALNNGTAEATQTFNRPLTGSTPYHWQARTCDQTGRCSAWTPFGGNAETAADFSILNALGL